MEPFLLGFKALWRVWNDPAFAARVLVLLEGRTEETKPPVPAAETTPAPMPPPIVQKAARSEALTLLSVLQREARLIDFLKEPIGSYSDGQIGAAVRTVHEDCRVVLDRLFGIEALRSEPEGARIEISEGFDPAQVRLTGNIPGHGPFRGALCHAGWKASRCEIPTWTGREDSERVLAPCEVEIR